MHYFRMFKKDQSFYLDMHQKLRGSILGMDPFSIQIS